MMEENSETLLSGFKVLDLTDEKGFLCGKILADLGAEVIKIEKPGGDPSRKVGPFYHDTPDSQMSLYWFAYNTGKWGITLNLESVEGKEIFKKMVAKADVVVESFSPGYMDQLGIGYSVLRVLNPRNIMTSITPYGQEGPYKNFAANDMSVMAMGGWAYLCGELEGIPVVTGVPQSFLCAAGDAAVGTLIALYECEQSGLGQQVDVSAQQSVVMDTREATPLWALNQRMAKRSSPYRIGLAKVGVRQRHLWPCKDGFVLWLSMGGMAGARENRVLIDWMASEGMASDFFKQMDWDRWDFHQATTAFFDQLEAEVGAFLLGHTKAELFEGAIKKNIILYPVSEVKDLIANVQLQNRDFWAEVEHPELGEKITYPGPFIKLSETPLADIRRAPLIGEHNVKIYPEWLGFSKQYVIGLKQAGVI
jgi:benzylsuccinate CoA-transferase BbsE subunit